MLSAISLPKISFIYLRSDGCSFSRFYKLNRQKQNNQQCQNEPTTKPEQQTNETLTNIQGRHVSTFRVYLIERYWIAHVKDGGMRM